jgi:hypothetical protein
MPRQKACPSSDCGAANPSQRDCSTDLASLGETAEWARSAMMCSYCGCVYTGYGEARRIKGHLDNPLVGKGWQPIAPRP